MNMLLKCIFSGILFTGFILLPVHAQPGSGIRVGENSVLVPEVNASFNYNDNVALRQQAVSEEDGTPLNQNESDTYLNTQASLALRHWGDFAQYTLRGWLSTRKYDKNSNLDRDTYGVNGGMFWTSSDLKTSVGGDLSYQRATDRTEISESFVGQTNESDTFENVSERVERDELRANANVSHQLLNRLRVTGGYNITDIAYVEEIYNDRTSQLITGELAYTLSDKTAPYVRVGLGLDEDEGFADTAEKPFYLVGFRYTLTDKLNVDAAVGYESFTRTPYEFVPNFVERRFDKVPGEEEKDSGMKYVFTVNYAATSKLRLSLNARNGFGSVASTGSNSREEMAATFAMTHQTTRQLRQRLSASWREDDYLEPFLSEGEEIDELKETLWYQYRIDYQTVRPWLSLFANVSYEEGTSNLPDNDYDEFEVTVGATARY